MSYKITKKATPFTGQLFLKEDIIKILDLWSLRYD